VDQLEQMLRDTLTDSRLDLMVRPTAVELVHQGVRRRRRNRRVASAAAVAAVGVASAATLITTTLAPTTAVVTSPATPSPTPIVKPPAPETKTTNVPWQNIHYDYTSPPSFPGAVADPSVPWCRASQLTLSTFFQGATGNSAGGATLVNSSAESCALQGEPGVRIVDSAGKTLVSHQPETFYVYPWLKLTPGMHAAVSIWWYQEFCNEPVPAALQLILPRDGGQLTSTNVRAPRCNTSTDPPTAGSLDVDGFVYDIGESPFTPEETLQAQVTAAPTAVVAGSTLTYAVKLSNDTGSAVALSPCLPFRERLVNQVTGAVIEEDHLLNCSAAPASLDNNAALDFEMKLAVPPTAVTGNYALTWQSVLKDVSAVDEGVVRIDGSPPPCRDGQLSATAAPSPGSLMNQFGQVVIFTNTSSAACSLRGYPGLQLVDSGGTPMTVPVQRGGGYVFADPDWTTVVLTARGGQASFTFGGEAADMQNGGKSCPQAAGIRVIPPGDREQLSAAITVPACPAGIDVAKVVTGSAGSHF
jgi:methionine-rich copper-binding protein CopC